MSNPNASLGLVTCGRGCCCARGVEIEIPSSTAATISLRMLRILRVFGIGLCWSVARGRDAFLDGRVRVEEPDDGRRRTLLGEVLRAEAAHRRHERGRSAGQLQRIAVGAALVVA